MITYLRLDTNTVVKTGVELRTVLNMGVPYRTVTVDEAMTFLKAEIWLQKPKRKKRHGGRRS